jgi:hypothetical protein
MKYAMAARSITAPSVDPTDAAITTGVEVESCESDDGDGNPAAAAAVAAMRS